MNAVAASGSLARAGGGRLELACMVVAGILSLALAISYFNPPQLQEKLPAASMVADGGFGYAAALSLQPPFGFRVATDNPDGSRSLLRLYENGQLLGPAHSPHAIRERGYGRYSHWNGQLWFSSSDS